jgi:hypothetical protein
MSERGDIIPLLTHDTIKGLTTSWHCDMNRIQARRKMARYRLLVWWRGENRECGLAYVI